MLVLELNVGSGSDSDSRCKFGVFLGFVSFRVPARVFFSSRLRVSSSELHVQFEVQLRESLWYFGSSSSGSHLFFSGLGSCFLAIRFQFFTIWKF